MTCTFFGHSSVSRETLIPLTKVLTNLIENKGVDIFYVGNHGGYDRMVMAKLREMKKKYPHIDYKVVLAYIPTKKDEYEDYSETLYPSVLDGVPYRARIVKRNEWMIKKSDYVVTYVEQNIGGAAKSKEKAEKEGKKVINLAEFKEG